jgi:hypothetical protein
MKATNLPLLGFPSQYYHLCLGFPEKAAMTAEQQRWLIASL